MVVNISIIIVSHNSKLFLKKNLLSLDAQKSLPNEVIIVDSGSDDVTYINEIIEDVDLLTIKLICCENVGFAKANNIGISRLSVDCTQVIFLNPDCFLPPAFISSLFSIIQNYPSAGLLTGKLEGYDIATNLNTGLLDSTGIFQTYYGRWYDRGQGEADVGQYDGEYAQFVPAVCGALMICRREVIDLIFKQDGYFFNEDFFMYKEDIEISLRIKKFGLDILYLSGLVAHHCRGWKGNRRKISRWARLRSAKNDVLIALKFRQKALLYSGVKYLLVLVFDI